MSKDTNTVGEVSPKFPLDGYGITKELYLKNPTLMVHKYIAQSFSDGLDKLLGDLLTIVDCIGLQERQDKAVKDQITKAFYERYGMTADSLINIPFAVGFDKDDKQSLEFYSPKRNSIICSWSADTPMGEQI